MTEIYDNTMTKKDQTAMVYKTQYIEHNKSKKVYR